MLVKTSYDSDYVEYLLKKDPKALTLDITNVDLQTIVDLTSDYSRNFDHYKSDYARDYMIDNWSDFIIDTSDEDWSHSSTRKAIMEKVKETIEKQFHGDEIKGYIKSQVEKDLHSFKADVISTLDRVIKAQVEQKVNDIFKDKLISEIFSRLTSSNKSE